MGQLIDGKECVIKAVHITEALEAEEEAAIGVGIPFKGHLLILSAPTPNGSIVFQTGAIG